MSFCRCSYVYDARNRWCILKESDAFWLIDMVPYELPVNVTVKRKWPSETVMEWYDESLRPPQNWRMHYSETKFFPPKQTSLKKEFFVLSGRTASSRPDYEAVRYCSAVYLGMSLV